MKEKLIFFSLAALIFFSLPAAGKAFAEAEPVVTAQAPYGEHIRLVSDVTEIPMEIEVYGQSGSKTVPGSDYIPVCSTDFVQVVCGGKPESAVLRGGEFYIYFYDQDRNVRWDILDHTDDKTGERNRVSVQYLKELNGFQFTDIPDGSYIRIAPANDHQCQLLIWDGCRAGYPITGLATVFDADGEKNRLPEDGSACIQVPKTALYLIAKPGYSFVNMVTSNHELSKSVSDADDRFPAQFVRLRGFEGAGRAKNIRIVADYDYETGMFSPVMPNVDLSDSIIAVDETVFERVAASDRVLSPVYRNIRAIMDFTWEAAADITDCWGAEGRDGVAGTFRKGISYHGIPYRSSWAAPTSVGWHVSKQTFMNAVNDPDSIFYHNPSKNSPGPYYSLVCSSFGTLVSGFSYPMTNFSMMKDPLIQVEKTDSPILGTLMTKGYGHCFVPVDLSVDPEGSSVLTLAEQIVPLTSYRNVYPGISTSWKGIGPHSAYPSEYVYSVTPASFSDIPYDITRYTIKNGSARPFRGDQSVYTSAMSVLINIKDPDATRLYYQQFDISCTHGLPVSITPLDKPRFLDIEPGTAQISLRSATGRDGTFSGVPLENGGIYGVWASIGNQQNIAPSNVEFFEWYDLASETISYDVADGTLVTDDIFWYAITSAFNETDYITKKSIAGGLSIPYQPPVQAEGQTAPHSDYSNYAERAQLQSADSVRAFFRKGAFGAYVTGMAVIDN